MSASDVDTDAFAGRVRRLFAAWDGGYSTPTSPFYGMEGIVILSGKTVKDVEGDPCERATLVQKWLTSLQFPDMLIVFLRDKHQVIALGSAKKLSFFEISKDKYDHMLFLQRTPEETTKHVTTIFDMFQKQMDAASSDDNMTKCIGTLNADTVNGPFADEWSTKMKESGFTTRDCEKCFSNVMAVKDSKEIHAISKAGNLSCAIYRDVVLDCIEETLDSEAKKAHSEIANLGDKALDNATLMKKWEAKYNITRDDCDPEFTIVQSGGQYQLRVTAEASNEALCLTDGCIIVGCGIKYKEYASGLARTLLLNPSSEQKQAYVATMAAMEAVMKALIPNTTFKAVWEAGVNAIQQKHAGWEKNFIKTVGNVVGLQFRDKNYLINEQNETAVVLPGMTIFIQVGLTGLKSSSAGGQEFATYLADTIVIPLPEKATAGGWAVEQDVLCRLLKTGVEIEDVGLPDYTSGKIKVRDLTAAQKRSLQANSYELNDGDEDDEADNDSDDSDAKSKNKSKDGKSKKDKQSSDGKRKSTGPVLKERLRARKGVMSEDDAKAVEDKQKQLRQKKVEDMKARYADDDNPGGKKKDAPVRKMASITTYNDPGGYPREAQSRPGKIVLDTNKDAILVPLGGTHVPFHVSTVKNVSCTAEENKKHSLRINFQVPGSMGSMKEDNPLPELTDPRSVFVKELVYRSEDEKGLNDVMRRLKDLIKKVKTKQSLEDEKRDLVEQAVLQLNKTGRKPVLKELMVRPNIGGSKKIIGNVEAHTNGLRFSAARASENIDIIYSNIKHMIFQPCENELLVILHFHLYHPILIGKKKTHDIQFFREAGSQTDDLDMRRGRHGNDPDEIAEEERELRHRRELNEKFKKFAQEVESISGKECDEPYRDLAFYGVPSKANVLIIPTVNCLVHLIEGWPPFILTLEDIEVVVFERVMHGLRNFDMVFLFTDLSKPIRRIDNIPMEQLEVLKKWLNELDIVWYSQVQNLNWPIIIKTIVADGVAAFAENGGFETILGESEAGSGEEDESDDEEDDFKGDDSSEFDEDDDDSDESSLVEEDSSDSEAEMDSEEEEGMDWDEMEEAALEEEKTKRLRGDEGDDESSGKARGAKQQKRKK